MAKIHYLKIEPQYYKEVFLGHKTFEIRKNDRDFKVGDDVILQEYISSKREYTGNQLAREITYITDYAQHEDYVVFSIQ